MGAASELLKLAEKKFGKLTPAEKKLFRRTAEGEIADYSPKSKKPIEPANAAKWGPSRVLLADRIAWLCTDKQAAQLVTHRGILIKGARIDEELDLAHARVPFPLLFEKCKITAELHFLRAHIVALYMLGTHIGKLFAGGLRTTGPVYFGDNFAADDEVRLIEASLGGNLDCRNGQFTNKGGHALSADGLKVEGGVFLSAGFRADGEVCLLGATVGGNLDCEGAEFVNSDGVALRADGLKVGQSVYLRKGFQAKGEVCLNRATVRGDLDCSEGQFIKKHGRALSADRLRVDGCVYLCSDLKVEGIVRFGAARIGRCFFLADLNSPEEMTLDLGSAKIGILHYDKIESWPKPGRLVLRALEYLEISDRSPKDSKMHIEWLRRQKGFWPQPYEQLAKVLRQSGDGAGAREVLVAKNKDKAKRTKLTFPEKCWYHVLGRSIGYGHKPWLAIPLALVIVLFGSMFFKEGYSHGLVTPLSEAAYAEDNTGTHRISEVYPVFNSFIYSLDVFVPVVDLHQVKYWLPNANRGAELVPTSSAALCTGGLLLSWLWIETALGWILTTLFLVGLTGLVRT